MQLIPSLDLRGGRCVRLHQGDFLAETRYEVEPFELLTRYAAMGARWLHLVDLDGARDGRLAHRKEIAALAAQSEVRLQVGGGVRSGAVVDDLLSAGVTRVVIGTAAVDDAEQVVGWLQEHGSERVCLALDVLLGENGIPLIRTRGWREATEIALWDVVDRFAAVGLKHVLCTDIQRDGALTGPNVALYAEAVRRFPAIAWQASGGVSCARDLHALADAGVAAAISGKALLEGRLTLEELQPFLRDA